MDEAEKRMLNKAKDLVAWCECAVCEKCNFFEGEHCTVREPYTWEIGDDDK